MELLGFFVHPLVLIFVGYVLGMFVVGFPMGLWSLRAWKDPSRKILSFMLFPFATFLGDVGKEYPTSGLPAAIWWYGCTKHSVLAGDSDEDCGKRAAYTSATMFFWPLRVCSLVFLYCIAGPVLSFVLLSSIVKSCLLMCKKCIRV